MQDMHPRWAADHDAFSATTNNHVLARARAAASFVAPGSRVLDLGCGAMILREELPKDCSYTPVDLWQRHPDIIVANLNEGEFPEGAWDTIVILGVIEYLENPSLVLRTAHLRAQQLIITCPTWPILNARSIQHPEARGQVNYFRTADFSSLLRRTGWTIERRATFWRRHRWLVNEWMFVCR